MKKQQPTTIKGIKKSFFVVIEALWKRTKKSDVFYVQNYSWEWVEEALDRVRRQERTEILKEIDDIVNKKFPIGERRWCIECARRIRTKLKQVLKK